MLFFQSVCHWINMLLWNFFQIWQANIFQCNPLAKCFWPILAFIFTTESQYQHCCTLCEDFHQQVKFENVWVTELHFLTCSGDFQKVFFKYLVDFGVLCLFKPTWARHVQSSHKSDWRLTCILGCLPTGGGLASVLKVSKISKKSSSDSKS